MQPAASSLKRWASPLDQEKKYRGEKACDKRQQQQQHNNNNNLTKQSPS